MSGQTQTDERKIRVSFHGLSVGEIPHVTVVFPDARGTVTRVIDGQPNPELEAWIASVAAEAEAL